MITIESWIRQDSLRLERLIFGIEIAILHVFIQLTMELVCAAFHHRIELAARGVSELGLKLILKQRKFRYGFARDGRIRPGDVFSIIVDALDREIIVARTLTADRRA